LITNLNMSSELEMTVGAADGAYTSVTRDICSRRAIADFDGADAEPSPRIRDAEVDCFSAPVANRQGEVGAAIIGMSHVTPPRVLSTTSLAIRRIFLHRRH
jgi:hypothetical protein